MFKKFRPLICGEKLTIRTDHHPLVHNLRNQNEDHASNLSSQTTTAADNAMNMHASQEQGNKSLREYQTHDMGILSLHVLNILICYFPFP